MSELTAPAAGGSTRWRAGAGFLILSARCLRLSRRNVDALMTALLLPVMIMVMFVELFGGAIDAGGNYVHYVVPGVLLLCVGFGSGTTAVTVCQDLTGGIVDRFRSMDVGGAALLGGHVLASTLRNAVSAGLVLVVALLLGFRSSADGWHWLAAAAVLLLFVQALSWLGAVVGLLARSPEAAGGFTFFAMFLTYPSSAFAPIATMPSWIQGFARNQPVTQVIETLRGLLLGTELGSHPAAALGWSFGVTAASMAAAAVLFRRRTS